MFRLVSPKRNRGPCGPSGDALFPLPLNPDRFEYTLPFAEECTPQQEGGVVVEGTGIVIASITMSGTTGFRTRLQRTSFRGGSGGQFTGYLAEAGNVLLEHVSGQMAFWILASKCFEGYSELRKDPETSAGTRLELHIPKETLGLEVVPKSFGLTRAASSERVTYRYQITLDVLGPADSVRELEEDEQDMFDAVLDTITTMRDTLQQTAAVVDDLTAQADHLRRTWQSFSGLMDDVGTIFDSCTDFVTGVRGFVSVPKTFMTATADTIDSAIDFFQESATLPADVGQSFAGLGDHLDSLIVSCRNNYRSSWQDVADAYNRKAKARYSVSVTDDDEKDELELTAAAALAAGGTLTADQVYSSKFLPGDARRSRISTAGSRLKTEAYTGFFEKPVGQGDTLASIAARELGDARKWPELALVNNLSPPYISNLKLPGTLQPGKRIIIPVAKPVQPAQVLSTGDPEIGASQANAHLGVDYELVEVSPGQWGWKIDVTHGSVDGVKTKGIGNLAQGLGSRLRTERRSNILYPNLGLRRQVAVNQTENTATDTLFDIRQQILADPRVDRLHSARVSTVADRVEIEIKAQPVGSSTPRTISQILT
jgi:hypothetical protein